MDTSFGVTEKFQATAENHTWTQMASTLHFEKLKDKDFDFDNKRELSTT